MNKKGFTLVELLAVIAILAILIIIALPNVMKLFNDAKVNSFKNELKEIYKTAQQQWISDSMLVTLQRPYARGVTGDKCTGEKQLELVGRSEINYAIVVSKAGDVVNFVATDGTYGYQFKGTSAGKGNALLIENVGADGPVEGTGAGKGVLSPNAVVRLSDYDKTSGEIKCATDSTGDSATDFNYSLTYLPA